MFTSLMYLRVVGINVFTANQVFSDKLNDRKTVAKNVTLLNHIFTESD